MTINSAPPAFEFESEHSEAIPFEHTSRISLLPFNSIEADMQRRYLIKGLLPREGIAVVWGPPKSGKSFWTFDLMMHVALGWPYRGRRVHAGPVVYCALEGQAGFRGRVEAFRKCFLEDHASDVPFYLQPATIDLVADQSKLASAIRRSLGAEPPVAIVIDTLNRSLKGSESSDQDMAAYIKAADALRSAFRCAIVIVHHSGIDSSRPRGHTSLSGAVESQIAIKRKNGMIAAKVELMKDGREGDVISSRLETIDIGVDEDGDVISSCVVREAVLMEKPPEREEKLTPNQLAMLTILREAMPKGLNVTAWNKKARAMGIGTSRKADLVDIRNALMRKQLVIEEENLWFVSKP